MLYMVLDGCEIAWIWLLLHERAAWVAMAAPGM
jgi:hypothetical protein